jgi:hypothetical protein
MVQALKAGSKGFMPLAQFKQSPEFRACTDKQQRWLLALVETGGDYTAATLTAYGSKNARQAQVFSYAVRDVPRVKAALDFYRGLTPLDVLLEEVTRNLNRAEPGSVSAQRLLAQKERLIRQSLGLAPVKDDDESETPATESRVPVGARPVRHRETGALMGYILPSGEAVQLMEAGQ